MRQLLLAGLFGCIVLGTGWLTGCSEENDYSVRSKTDLQRQSTDPKASSFLVRAQRAFERETYFRALALVDSAETYAPELADVPFLRARVYTELERYDEARSAYRRVLDLDPNYRGARLNLGNNASRQGNYRRAVNHYRNEFERYPTARVLIEMGRAYEQMNAPDSARMAFERALERDSMHAEAYARLAQWYEREGASEKALSLLDSALGLEPDNVNMLFMKGSLLFEAGAVNESVDYLRRVVDQRPSYQPARYKLGQALVRVGREEEADRHLAAADSLGQVERDIRQLKERAQVNKDRPRAWVDLGNRLRKAGRIDQAVDAYRTALYLSPQNLALHNNMANLHLMRGDTTAALRRYQSILRRDSSLVDVWLNIGSLYAELGRKQQARRAWEKVLELEPEHDTARRYLGTL